VDDEDARCLAACFAAGDPGLGLASVAGVAAWAGCCAVDAVPVCCVFFVCTYLPFGSFFGCLAGPEVSCANPVNAKQTPITTAKKNTNALFISLHLLQCVIESRHFSECNTPMNED